MVVGPLSLAGSAIMARLGSPLVIVMAAVLLALSAWGGVQTVRLAREQGSHEQTRSALRQLRDSIKTAAAESQARGAMTGQQAVEDLDHANVQNAPIVERVVTRVRNVCLREPAAGADDHLPLPDRTGQANDTAAGAGDAGDRAFAEAVARDIAVCANERERLIALQRWVSDNGGGLHER